mmetsp:Transcript_16715/g.21472  ORF Transcript_16715/g.21472 Transcript_16715/m.21472 type:complete len:138 (+) Transcript_16715:308-721(+)
MQKEGALGKANLIGVIKEVAPCATAETDEELGVEEFQSKYFPYPLYLDEEKGMYSYLGSRKLTSLPFTWNPFKLYKSFKAIGERIKEKNLEGNMRGEGLTLGGVIVYSPSKGVVYEYKEVTGKELPVEEISKAAKSL